MAKPVKETPVISGADARNFEKAIKANENKRVSRPEYERAMRAFKQIKFSV